MKTINKIVVHCSDSPDSIDFSAADIDLWHKQRGWSGIGYHYVIRRNGNIEKGRPDNKMGAHVKGHNRDSLAICVIGRKDYDQKQVVALDKLLKKLMKDNNLTIDDVFGHYELYEGKTCPNMDMNMVRARLIFKEKDESEPKCFITRLFSK